MRVECESCRELVVARFALEGDAIRATCPACQHVTEGSIEPRDAARGGVNASAPPVQRGREGPLSIDGCAKCGAALKPDAAACSACGLAMSRMAAFRDARDAAVAEPVRAAWIRAEDEWRDDARHDDLFRIAATHHAYAWTASRYRTRGKDAVAVRQLDRLRRAAEATLLAGATARPDKSAAPYRATAGVLIALVVVVAAGLLYAVVIKDRRVRPRPDRMAPVSSGPTGDGPPGSIAPNGTVRPLVPGHPVSSSTIK